MIIKMSTDWKFHLSQRIEAYQHSLERIIDRNMTGGLVARIDMAIPLIEEVNKMVNTFDNRSLIWEEIYGNII